MSQIPKAIAIVDYILGALFLALCLFLVTSPLHPAPGDRHGGVYGVIGGVIFSPLPILFFIAASLVRKQSKHAIFAQAIATGALALFLLFFIWGMRQ